MAVSLDDVQNQVPALHISLSRVGVTNVEKVIRIHTDGKERLFYAKLDCFVDLGPRQKGAHMSRFEEVVNDAIGEVILGESAFRAETLAQHIAEKVRDRQGARRAEVHIDARYPEYKPAPHSGIRTQEIYTLHGIAVAGEAGTKRLIGVTAQGMTACPCAQTLVQASSRERLLADGFDEDEIERIFDAVPVATHNQRGLGTLHVGCTEACDTDIDAQRLLAIVEDSMSSEIYELMKRSDEGAVVEKAHRRPRFVEDCVREMIRGVVEQLPELRDDAFVSARQENLETIHQHNVVADRHGLLGELRDELASGEHSARHVSLRDWLDGPLAAAEPRGARAGDDDHRDRGQLGRAEVLPEHDEAGERGDRRLERHQHAEDRLRDPPQRLELERVRQHRRRERDDERRAEQVGLAERAAALDEAGREHDQRADRHRERQPRAARERLAGALGQVDVGDPASGRREREQHAEAVDRAAARVGEQHDPGRGEHDPDDVERPPRADHGDQQRAGELDRDRDAERDPVHRLVDRPVHQPERDAERARDPQVAFEPRPPDRPQHERGEREPQERRAARPELVEQRHGERRADLQRARRGEHQPHRDAPLTAHGGRSCNKARMLDRKI